MRSMSPLTRCVVLCVILLPAAAASAGVTLESLLGELVDLPAIAEYPDPPFTCRQVSSYDRLATTAKDPDTWFANNDFSQFIRDEVTDGRTEHVMMDAKGPGAIVRIWSARPFGTMRIYLDGAVKPTWEVDMNELLTGRHKPVVPPIAGMRAKGTNLYFPIPYARSCKVTSDAKLTRDARGRRLPHSYYHINYRTYPPGTKVTSFDPSQLQTHAKQIGSLARSLAEPRAAAAPPKGSGTVQFKHRLAPGASATLADLRGPLAIRSFTAKVDATDLKKALRRLRLTIRFDDDETIDVPLGDFFGSAPGVIPYASLPAGMTEAGEMWCHWTMPFAKSAKVTVVNHGQEPVSLTGAFRTAPYRWTDRSMHFHAGWRMSTDYATRPFTDWNYLTATGRGVFVGAALTIGHPRGGWWGEGDEKIFVDGERFPSTFGTGTEDYFGYAWASKICFTHAYHNQPLAERRGMTSLNRWHVIDRIPFAKKFRFDMEIWSWPDTIMNMSVLPYWYARPGATDAFKPLTAEMLRQPFMPDLKIRKVEGALEGEAMKVVEKTGTTYLQHIPACSGEAHLWWRPGKVGGKLKLTFDAPKAGRFRVRAGFLKASNYGIAQLHINGVKAGKPIDLYSPTLAASKEIDLGRFELKQGANTFSAEIVGINPKARKGWMFSLDYIRCVAE